MRKAARIAAGRDALEGVYLEPSEVPSLRNQGKFIRTLRGTRVPMKAMFLCLASVVAAPALADTITYTFTVTGTGTLGGVPVVDSLVTFVAIADSAFPTDILEGTLTVGTLSYPLPPVFVSVHSGDCNTSPEFPAVHSCADLYSPLGDQVLISSNAIDSYQKGKSFTLATDPTPYVRSIIFTHSDAPTTLNLTSASNGTFSAVVTTPEARSSSTVVIGLAIIFLLYGARRVKENQIV